LGSRPLQAKSPVLMRRCVSSAAPAAGNFFPSERYVLIEN